MRFLKIALSCFFAFVITGCAQSSKPTNSVEVWHWMTDRHEVFEKLAQQYTEKTGVEVKFELFAPSDAYSQKVIAAAQSNVLPEVYGILDKKSIFASFIKAGYVANLSDAFKANDGAWENEFFPKAVAVNVFEEGNIYETPAGIYGVPLDVTNQQMLYNKDLLAKVGVTTPPQTFEEFLSVIDALNRIGISGFVSGFGELWLIDNFASNYAFNIMGEDKVMATYRGEVSYTDPDWIKVFGVFQTLAQRNAFVDGVVTKGNKYAEQDFALGRAAFSFNGSWCVNVYHDMNPKLNYGVMRPPKLVVENPLPVWGGAGSSFVVNNSSPNKEITIQFLEWLTQKEQQAFLSTETKNLPANRKATGNISPVLGDFAKGMDVSTHPTTWPLTEDPLVGEAYLKGIQSIIIGESTPEDIAQEVAKVKERQMAKKK